MAGIQDIAERAGVDAGLVRRFVEEVVVAITDGERVTLRGLGTFNKKTLPERTFKTALMKEPVTKPERETIAFKPSNQTVEALNAH